MYGSSTFTPWVSPVSDQLRLQITQEPAEPSIRCCRWQSITLRLVLAVAHPNRGEGDLRARVGLSAVLRQAAQVLLFAIEPPDDDTQLIVGTEKANAATRSPATLYRKVPRDHSCCPRALGGRRDHRRTQTDDPAVA